jgi:RNA polymerase sigma-54 factor
VRSGASVAGSGDFIDSVATEESLYDHLHAQIGTMRLTAECREAATLVADELDEDGYLRAPLPELAARHRLSLGTAGQALGVIQSCDPAGVGARSLQECLALQLREQNRLDPTIQALIDNLGLAVSGRAAELQRLSRADATELAEMLAELRALPPKPGLRFLRPPVQVAVPDVHVVRSAAGGWSVELNTETLPRVLVNNVYAARVRVQDPDARAFISECSASASWLVRSLEQRARTILKVATEITRHQERFFEHGTAQLRPLTQRMVAERVKMHESTISRVTAGKYLACDQGVFELRRFFSPALHSLSGGEDLSAAAVQERIRLVIGGENIARALSDDQIVTLLNAEGIDIARRTVAKYREGMGIPSSVQRRRLRTAAGGV